MSTGYSVRTENGTAALITTAEALAEMNSVQMDRKIKNSTRSIGISHDCRSAWIEYKGGRKVTIRPATEQDITDLTPVEQETTARGQRIVTAKGKRYVVDPIQAAIPYTPGARTWRPNAGVSYWTERNGNSFGPTLSATEASKPGTVGAAVWAAVSAGFEK